MQMTDPFTIQDSLNDLIRKHETLRAAIPEIMSFESPDDISEQRIIRGEYKIEVNKVIDALKDKQDELNTHIRSLRGIIREINSDDDKLERHLFTRLRERKTYNV